MADQQFTDTVSSLFDTKENIQIRNRKNLIKILKLFVSNGNFLPQKIVRINADTSNFSGSFILEKLLEHDIIVRHHESHMLEYEYIISTEYEDLLDAVTQGNSSIKMDKLVKLIS